MEEQLNRLLIAFIVCSIGMVTIIQVLKSPWFKGVLGEAVVNFCIKISLNKNNYHLLKNVTLPTEDGTTQIDHIIVSVFGIFIIETKNMEGWIFGSPNQKKWTQKIYKHTNSFQNPLHQNYKHTKTIERLLGIDSSLVHSVIAFIGNSEFKTEMPDNVTQGLGCIFYIKSKKQAVLSEEEVEYFLDEIQELRLESCAKTNRNHVEHVKQLRDKNRW